MPDPTASATGRKQAKKTPAKPAAKRTATKKPAAEAAVPAAQVSTGRSAAKKTTVTEATGPVSAEQLSVRPGETPWTADELREVRDELHADVDRLRQEIAVAESDLADLLRDPGDGAGDDQADAGTKAFEREHEMALANNSRDMLLQAERALQRIDNGTYGRCESCGNPIGKARLQVFPRATLCVSCKQREERR